MSDTDPAEMRLGVGVDEIEPVIFLLVQNPDGSLARVAMNRAQAYQLAERIIGALATLDARESERAALNALFNQQTESPEK